MNGDQNPLLIGDQRKTLVAMTVPIVIAMLLIGTTGVADMLFVARVGGLQLAALGFVIPIVSFSNQIFVAYGVGVAAVIARKVGSAPEQRPVGIAVQGIGLGLGGATVLAALAFLGSRSLLRSLGAGGEALALADDYLRVWLPQVPLTLVTIVGTSVLRATGKPRATATATLISSVVSVGLDPWLIFGGGPVPALGLRGAALATVIGSLAACLYTVRTLNATFAHDLPHARDPVPTWRATSAAVLSVAVPAMVTYGLMPLSIAFLTRLCASYDAHGVAAFAACTRMLTFVRTVPIAVAGAIGPFVGVNWAARSRDRALAGVAYGHRLAVVWSAVAASIFLSLGIPIGRALAVDRELASGIATGLAIVAFGLISEARVLIANSTFNNIGRPSLTGAGGVLRAALIASIGAAGVALFGINGVFGGLAASAIGADVVASIWLRNALKVQPSPYLAAGTAHSHAP